MQATLAGPDSYPVAILRVLGWEKIEGLGWGAHGVSWEGKKEKYPARAST